MKWHESSEKSHSEATLPFLDLYKVQHRKPHQPASYRLHHHRPAVLHRNQREVRGNVRTNWWKYRNEKTLNRQRFSFSGVKSHPGNIVTL